MEVLRPFLDFLSAHVVAAVFVSAFIEATGVPFPGRLILIIASTLVSDLRQLVSVGGAATLGSLIGDHVPYAAGYYMGPRLLDVYCRLTLGSERCVATTLAYFRRFGAAAVLVGRFSTSVRLLASALSGCGHISYPRFLICDLIGTLVYASLWVTLGYVFGSQVTELLRRYGALRYLVLIIPLAMVSIVAYRLWRRSHPRPGAGAPIPSGLACEIASAAAASRPGRGRQEALTGAGTPEPRFK